MRSMNRGLLAALMLSAAAAVSGTTTITSAPDRLPVFTPATGRGKGKTKSHDRGGTRAYQRAALKKRNQARHRKACR